jgi:excinuclease ABC subunit C
MFDVTNLPKNPGCYLFKNKNDKIIYVGKAKNIGKRVRSYVQKKDLDAKTQSLVKRVNFVDYIITDNEVEAFILENTLIKKYQPKYNIDLKDAKSYAYIRLTDENFPRILIARRKEGNGTFYGPFVSAKERDYVLRFLRKTFMLRDII